MIKDEVIQKTVTIKHRYCDDCGIKITQDMACSVAKCEICEKDLCYKCVGYEDFNTGDYRTVYCKKCWNIGETYRNEISKLENQIELLNDEWVNKCKT